MVKTAASAEVAQASDEGAKAPVGGGRVTHSIDLTTARRLAVDALVVLVDHFCYSEEGLHQIADEAWSKRRGGHDDV